jgi:hypothetical protein
MKNILLLFSLIFVSGHSYSQIKFNLSLVKPGRKFEFHQRSMIIECKDPHILKLHFLDSNKVVVRSWYKGCPNNRINEEELVYNYRIDNATNYRHEYSWLKSDTKVVVLTNESAGYYNGYSQLKKKYIISNAYDNSRYIDARIFEQLDIVEYPSRNGVFTTSGRLVKSF